MHLFSTYATTYTYHTLKQPHTYVVVDLLKINTLKCYIVTQIKFRYKGITQLHTQMIMDDYLYTYII